MTLVSGALDPTVHVGRLVTRRRRAFLPWRRVHVACAYDARSRTCELDPYTFIN